VAVRKKPKKKTRVASDLRLVKLDAAARRLGCHVETLRLKIRSGKLHAVHGPHGAYFIPFLSLVQLIARKPPAPPALKETDLELAWRKACLRARQQLGVEEDGPGYTRPSRRRYRRLPRRFRATRRQSPPPQELETLVNFLDALQAVSYTHLPSPRD